MSVALLDISALIALLDEQHIHHPYIQRWFTEQSGAKWATCPITENGFVRVFGSARYGSSGGTVSQAIATLRIATAVGEHEFWPADISLLDAMRFGGTEVAGPSAITDVYLLALAVQRDGRLITFDRSISPKAVKGAQPKHLVVLGVPAARD